MHFPRFLRRVNRSFTNPLMNRVAWLVPPLAIVHHVGRHSGRAYRTPVLAFRTRRGFVIPLTYGRDVDWARNLVAAGRGAVEQAGRRHEVVRPRIVGRDTAYRWLPPGVRSLLYAADLPGYVLLDLAGQAPAASPRRSGKPGAAKPTRPRRAPAGPRAARS